jgi:hypothetical protein
MVWSSTGGKAMSQLTIYLGEEAMRDVKTAARKERVSVSQWARRRLCEAVRHAWPPEYFSLFGALRDSDLQRPTQGRWSKDVKRRVL